MAIDIFLKNSIYHSKASEKTYKYILQSSFKFKQDDKALQILNIVVAN